MSFFVPSKPEKPGPPPKRGERGSRVRRSTTSVTEDEVAEHQRKPRGVRKNAQLKGPHNGFLCGEPTRGFYDLDGHYVRKRGRHFVIEWFGPHAALRALPEEDRARVMRARERDKPSRQMAKSKRRPGVWKDGPE